MRSTIRFAISWAPFALSVKNWVIDIRPIDGNFSLNHGSGSRVPGGTDWVVVQKYKIQVLRKFHRGQIIYLKSPEQPGTYWVRRLVGMEGDVVTHPLCEMMVTVPQGHCWVEPCEEDWVSDCCAVPLALVEGWISHILWPPSQAGVVRTHFPHTRIVVKGKC